MDVYDFETKKKEDILILEIFSSKIIFKYIKIIVLH